MEHLCKIISDWQKYKNITNPGFQRFVLGITKQILISKCSFRIVDHKSNKFSNLLNEFNKSSRIFSTIPQIGSLKIQICESRILTNPDCRTCESRSIKIWFMDLSGKNKNPKMLDSYRFVGIRPWILGKTDWAIQTLTKTCFCDIMKNNMKF